MKVYLVSGFSIDFGNAEWGSAPIESQVFATLEKAQMYVEECAELTTLVIQSDLGGNIYSDKVEDVYNSVIKQYRTIEAHIDLDKDSDNRFFKEHNLAQIQIDSFIYRQLDLSDRRLTSFKVLDMTITEIEL